MTSRFVLSFDFELMWGVRDHRSIRDYGDAVLGVREALPRLLRLIEHYGICATWATVGLLFARNRREMLEYYPDPRPEYRQKQLSPFETVRNGIGDDESSDPYHYGRSLLDRVMQTAGQEIGTHTYSHYYCLEEGESREAFDADLSAAIEIAAVAGVRPVSIVFPRNQMSERHVGQCVGHGITVFRGNQGGYLYRPRPKAQISRTVRALRLLDAGLPVTGRHSYARIGSLAGGRDVRASRFFRPYAARLGRLNDLHVRRIVGEMTSAAGAGETYHLWCHPHNFGRHTDVQLSRMETIFKAYRRLSDAHGMQSCSMAGCAQQAVLSLSTS